MRPFAVVLVALVLVAAGYLAGRGRGDLRSSYLHVVALLGLIVGAFGLVVALDGIVAVALPSQTRSAGVFGPAAPGFGRRVAPEPPNGPMRGFDPRGYLMAPGGGPGQQMAPASPGESPAPGRVPRGHRKKMRGRSLGREAKREAAEPDVRGAGIVHMLRGFILLLVGGAVWLYHWRRAESELRPRTAPPPPPASV